MRTPITVIVVSLLASACMHASAAVPPTQRSAADEEALAKRDDHAAGVLERQGDLAADTQECGPLMEGKAASTCSQPPRPDAETAENNARANELRDAAQQHRKAALVLEAARAAACGGLTNEEATFDPFAHAEDLVDVQVLTRAGRDGQSETSGARVRFHQIGGVSADRLQRVVGCRVATDRTEPDGAGDKAYSPLAPAGVVATVTTIPHGYFIDIQSDDPEGAHEIVRRALALRPVAY